jgi:hypothetical protein
VLIEIIEMTVTRKLLDKKSAAAFAMLSWSTEKCRVLSKVFIFQLILFKYGTIIAKLMNLLKDFFSKTNFKDLILSSICESEKYRLYSNDQRQNFYSSNLHDYLLAKDHMFLDQTRQYTRTNKFLLSTCDF